MQRPQKRLSWAAEGEPLWPAHRNSNPQPAGNVYEGPRCVKDQGLQASTGGVRLRRSRTPDIRAKGLKVGE